jgi:hypothetical protein
MKDSDFQNLCEGIREAGAYLRENTRFAGPTAREKQLLDEAQAAYDSNPNAGSPWSAVENRLRRRV